MRLQPLVSYPGDSLEVENLFFSSIFTQGDNNIGGQRAVMYPRHPYYDYRPTHMIFSVCGQVGGSIGLPIGIMHEVFLTPAPGSSEGMGATIPLPPICDLTDIHYTILHGKAWNNG